jgi:D-alanyl-D-alanine carboxypeptidase
MAFSISKVLKFGITSASLAVLFSSTVYANPTLVVDMRTGQVISADEATRPWHPASTTKLMTTYVALKMLKAGEVKLDTPLQGSRKAAAQKPSKIGIKPGQIITLDNALKILLVKSANDVAYVIAENLSGSADSFVNRMNAEAQRLGMRETHFTNPNGWHDSSQQTSARDLAILARALYLEFPDYREYWGIGSLRLGNKIYKNTNGLIGRYDGAIGMKTGFVCASGFNVVALAERGGQTLLTIVLGATTSSGRTVQAAQLFDQGFQGGNTGQSLQGLPSSGYQNASSIRGQVCNGRRGIPLTDEDYDGAITSSSTQDAGGDKDSIYATMRGDQGGTQRRSPARYALGERNLGEPMPVYLGRAPGNTDSVMFARLGGKESNAKEPAKTKLTNTDLGAEAVTAIGVPRKKQVKQPKDQTTRSTHRASVVKDNMANLKLRPVESIIQPGPAAINAPMALRPAAKAGIRSNQTSANQAPAPQRKLGAIEREAKQPTKTTLELEKPTKNKENAKNALIRPAPIKAKSAPKISSDDE